MNSRNPSELLQNSVRWSKLAKSNAGSLFSVNDECLSKESAAPPMLQSAECSLNRTNAAKIPPQAVRNAAVWGSQPAALKTAEESRNRRNSLRCRWAATGEWGEGNWEKRRNSSETVIIETRLIKKKKRLTTADKLDKVEKWRQLQQTSRLESPGKDLLIPHVPRDGGEQMLPGRSSHRTKDRTAISAPSDFSELLP